jgi:hypothetical protein
MKINDLVNENDMVNFFKDLQKNNPKFKNLRVHGDPEHDELRKQDAINREKQRADAFAKAKEHEQARIEQDRTNLPDLEAELHMLQRNFDPNYEYSDDHTFWTNQKSLHNEISALKQRIHKAKQLGESATAGATSAANIGTVDAPQLSPGKARGKKSYTGSVATGSGTKAPPQPKVNQPKNKDGTAKNGLDIKGTSLFGGPANEAVVIKRR